MNDDRDIPPEQLAADGEDVVDGLTEDDILTEHEEEESPDEGG